MSTPLRTVVRSLLTVGLAALAPAAAAFGQANQEPEVPRVSFLQPPPPFGEAEQAEVSRLLERLRGLTGLHDPEVSEAREAELKREAQGLLGRLDELRAQRRAWADYQQAIEVQEPDRPEHRYLEGGIDDQVDLGEVLKLYDRFRQMDYARDPNAVDAEHSGRIGVPAPEPRGPELSAPTWKQWEDLAHAFDCYRGVRFKLKNTRLGMFHLRSFLIQGKCWLYAAVEHWHDGRRVLAFRDYENGLRILHRVLVLAHESKRVGGLEKLDALPADMNDFMKWEPGKPSFQHFRYAGIPLLRTTSTAAEARHALSQFCPWGVEVYFFLKRIGYTAGLDLDILSPFYEAEGLGQAPKLCVQTLSGDAVPQHIRADMAALMGGASKNGTLRYPSGKSTPIEWHALTKPTCSLWIISPGVFDLKPSEILDVTAHLRKILFGFAGDDPRMYGQRGYLMDITLDQEVELAEWQAGGKKGVFYATSKLIVEAENAGIDADLLFDYADKGFNWTKLVGFVAGKTFGWMEQKELEWLFDGLEPRNRQFGDFKTYGDTGVFGCGRIPPILIRAELYGVEKTRPYEYRRKSRIVRYYVLDPGALSGLDDLYQLNDFMSAQVQPLANADAYVAGNAAVVAKTWAPPPRKPPPPGQAPLRGVRRYVVDTAPKAQTVHLAFDRKLYEVWKKESEGAPLEVRFYDALQEGVPAAAQKDFARIPLNTPYVTAQFVNARLFPQGLSFPLRPGGAESQAGPPEWCLLAGIAGKMQFRLPDPERTGPVLEPGALQAPEMGGHCVLWELTRDYTVRVMAGDVVRAEFPLIFMGSKGRGITGKQTWPFPNVCLTIQRYPDVRNEPIAVKPNFKDLLPLGVAAGASSLHGKNTSGKDGQLDLLEMPFRDSDAVVSVRLTGFELDRDYYRASVTLAGRSFTAWGKARGACGGADMTCDIAVPPGRHEVVITVPRAKGVRCSLIIERQACPYRVSEDLQRAQQSYAKARAKYGQTRSRQDAGSLAYCCVKLADQLDNYGEYQRAYELCLEAQKLPSDRDLAKDTSFCSVLYESAFHTGDAKAVLWAGPRYIENLYGRDLQEDLQKYGRGHERVTSRAGSIANTFAETIRRFVSLGGDPANAGKLHWRMVELWALAGYDDWMGGFYLDGLNTEWGMEPGRTR